MTRNRIASEILHQLGGNKFIAMTGAKGLMTNGEDLTFKIPRSNGINCMRITLNSSDTYDVEFLYISRTTVTTKKSFSGIYNDMLQNIFTETTGLHTSL